MNLEEFWPYRRIYTHTGVCLRFPTNLVTFFFFDLYRLSQSVSKMLQMVFKVFLKFLWSVSDAIKCSHSSHTSSSHRWMLVDFIHVTDITGHHTMTLESYLHQETAPTLICQNSLNSLNTQWFTVSIIASTKAVWNLHINM